MKNISINFNYLALIAILVIIPFSQNKEDMFVHILGILYSIKLLIVVLVSIFIVFVNRVVKKVSLNKLEKEQRDSFFLVQKKLSNFSYKVLLKFLFLSALQVFLAYQALNSTGDYQLLLILLIGIYFLIDTFQKKKK